MRKTILAAATTAVVLEVLSVAGCGGGNGSSGLYVPAPISTGTGTSVPIGSLLQARDGAACALVGTGSVLVAGGRTGDAAATDTAEMIDASGTVSPVLGKMLAARAGARAVRLDGDSVLVIGGHDGQGRPLASTEIYSHYWGTFFVGPLLAAPRDGSSVAVVDSTIYVFGGKGQKTVEAIETDRSTVPYTLRPRTLKGSFDLCHEGAQAASSGHIMIVGGGRDVDGAEAYDLDAEKTVPLAYKDQIRGDTLVATKASVLFVGGGGESSLLLAATKEFATDLHASPTLGIGRVHGTAVRFMDGTLVLGGDDRSAPIAPTDIIHSTTSWEPGPSLSIPRDDASAVTLEDGRVVVVGGRIATGAPCGDCEMLLPPGAARPTSSATLARYTSLELQLLTAIDQIVEQNKLLAAAQEQNRLLAQELAAVTAQRDQLTVEVANYKGQLETANEALAATRKQLDDANAQIASLTAQLAAANADRASLQAQLATANANAAAANARIATLQGRAQNAESSLANANGTISQLQGQVAQLQGQLAATQSQLQSAQAQVTKLQQTPPPAASAPPPIVPAPPVYAAVPTLPTIDYGPAVQASTDSRRPIIVAVDPTTISHGQTVRVWMSQNGSFNKVLFGGVAGQTGTFSAAYYQGVMRTYIDVTVPTLPLSWNRTAVQVQGDGLTSDAVFVFVK